VPLKGDFNVFTQKKFAEKIGLLTVIRKRIFPVIGRQGLCGLA
jgi:hypothetical protein